MPTCMALGCSNTSGKSGKNITYFNFPNHEPPRVRRWIANLKREDLPSNFWPEKNNVICSQHFEDECFEDDMKARILAEVHGEKSRLAFQRRKLTPTAIPTVFSYTTEKRKRSLSTNRSLLRQQCHMVSEALGSTGANGDRRSVTVQERSSPVSTKSTPIKKIRSFCDSATQCIIKETCDTGVQCELLSRYDGRPVWTGTVSRHVIKLDHCYSRETPEMTSNRKTSTPRKRQMCERIRDADFVSGEASLDLQSPDFVPSGFVNTKNSQNREANVERYNRKMRRGDNIEEPPDQPNSCDTPEQQDESNMEHCPDVLKLEVIEEELPAKEQIRSPALAQKPPQIKEEQEDTDITKFTFDHVSVKSEDREEKPQLPDLLHCKTEESRDYLGTDQCLKSDDEDKTSNSSSETDVSDGNWEESEAQSGIDSEKNNEVAFGNRKCKKGKKLHICPDCGKTFKSRQGLVGHNRIHTGENPFSCSICNKAFSSKGNLQKHTKVHTGERPFKCSICGRALKSKNALIEHTRTHTGEKPYSCPLCGRSFGFKSYLTVHMQYHSEEKPHRCSVCTAAFKRRNDLLAHVKTHTGEKPYSCSVCGKNFAHCVSLTCHMRSHTGERPYSCSVCKATFKWRKTFRNHTKIHSDE